jgi:hypothetical protein
MDKSLKDLIVIDPTCNGEYVYVHEDNLELVLGCLMGIIDCAPLYIESQPLYILWVV